MSTFVLTIVVYHAADAGRESVRRRRVGGQSSVEHRLHHTAHTEKRLKVATFVSTIVVYHAADAGTRVRRQVERRWTKLC